MVLDASLLNTQHYKVRIKGKVEQYREGVAPSPTHWCSSYWKGSLRVTLDYGRQLYLLTYICNYTCINTTTQWRRWRATQSFRKICTSHFIERVRKGLLKVLLWEGVGDRTELQHIDPTLMAISVVSFSFSRAAPGGLGASLSGYWLPLPHLVSNSSVLQLTDFLSPPSYIIVQSPALYLWNGMFDRHQAEITVMQFTGHSLPVH